MRPQPMGQPSFFYYNPEPMNDHRQHGHFSQHPRAGHEETQIHTVPQQFYPSEAMMHHGQHLMMYPPMHQKPILGSSVPHTPRPEAHFAPEHPSLILNTQCITPNMKFDPATPALTEPRSGSSSPPSTCGLLPTPVTGNFFSSGVIEGVKEGCEGDVSTEILAGGEFARACSPPLTPGKANYVYSVLDRLEANRDLTEKSSSTHPLWLPVKQLICYRFNPARRCLHLHRQVLNPLCPRQSSTSATLGIYW